MTTPKRKPVVRKATTAAKRTTVKKPVAKTPVRSANPTPAPRVKLIAQLAATIKRTAGGQPVHVLTVPWEEKGLAGKYGAKWDSSLRQFIYIGAALPVALKDYTCEAFSLERWIQDEINGYQPRAIIQPLMSPRPHQVIAIKRITAAARSGLRGFLEADNVGVGKTLSSLIGASEAAKVKGFTSRNPAKTLIICPKSVIPHWKNAIKAVNTPELRIVVINYDQAKKLLSVPASAKTAKTTRTKNKRIAGGGTPNIEWDIIIADEAHKLKNESQRTAAFDKIARYTEEAKTAPFVIWVSATIGQNPLELRYLAPLVGQLTGKKTLSTKTWGAFLEGQGYNVVKGKVNYSWIKSKKEDTIGQKQSTLRKQQADVNKLALILFAPNAPSIRRSPEDIAGWPSIQRILTPVALDIANKGRYLQAWLEFRRFLQLNPRGKNPSGGLAAELRFRQKASLLMLPSTIEFAEDLLDNGLQVVISVQFMETLQLLKTHFEAQGIGVSEFSGANPANREQERINFQKGLTQVMLFTVVEGISLHAGEQLADGTHATSTSRATIVHDIRYSGMELVQIEGRAHRDGQSSNVYYMYAQGTVQEKITKTMIQRMAHMSALSGDDSAVVDEIQKILDTF
jgi:superfamily II DNA or RNA helicase